MRGARKGPAISPSPGRSGDPHRLRRHGRITIRPGYAAGARDADGGVIGSLLRSRAGLDGAIPAPSARLTCINAPAPVRF